MFSTPKARDLQRPGLPMRARSIVFGYCDNTVAARAFYGTSQIWVRGGLRESAALRLQLLFGSREA
jgi:hypothetical protein